MPGVRCEGVDVLSPENRAEYTFGGIGGIKSFKGTFEVRFSISAFSRSINSDMDVIALVSWSAFNL
jgi:hypothetical protein